MDTNLNNIITIYSEQTPNPETMKFVLNKMILPGQSADFPQRGSAEKSALAQTLFQFSYVEGVFIMNNFVTITKGKSFEWYDLVPQLKEFIKGYVEAGESIVYPDFEESSSADESEIVMKIRELLDNHVKPAVEMDGGAISFKSFDHGKVTVVLKGSCSGCPSSTITLKAGIEGLLKRMIPEVTEVVAEAD